MSIYWWADWSWRFDDKTFAPQLLFMLMFTMIFHEKTCKFYAKAAEMKIWLRKFSCPWGGRSWCFFSVYAAIFAIFDKFQPPPCYTNTLDGLKAWQTSRYLTPEGLSESHFHFNHSHRSRRFFFLRSHRLRLRFLPTHFAKLDSFIYFEWIAKKIF